MMQRFTTTVSLSKEDKEKQDKCEALGFTIMDTFRRGQDEILKENKRQQK